MAAPVDTNPPSSDTVVLSPPLAKLPGELRNRIYRLSVVYDKPIEIRECRPKWSTKNTLIRYKEPYLIQTCRQIRAEASSIYYGENTFTYSRRSNMKTDALEQFLSLLGPRRAAMINKLIHRRFTSSLPEVLAWDYVDADPEPQSHRLSHSTIWHVCSEQFIPHIAQLVHNGLDLNALILPESREICTINDLMEIRHRRALRMAIRWFREESLEESEDVVFAEPKRRSRQA